MVARTAQSLLILAALAVALGVGIVRMGVEGAARSVAIVLDGNDARALAVESGRSLERTLVKFRTAGLTGVAAFDQALPDLVADGQVSVVPAAWMQDPTEAGVETGISIVAADPAVGRAIAERLVARFPLSQLDFPASGSEGGGYDQIVFRGRRDQIEAMGLGLNRAVVEAADAAGLMIVARTLNYPGVTNLAIRNTIGDIAAQQAGYMVFGEDEVLGYPDLLPELAGALDEGGVTYGSVEFAGQQGDAELCRLLDGAVVRVHSITEKELPNLSPEQATQRFVRAAVERNVRVCYVRALSGGWDDRFSANLHYVHDIAEGLKAKGFALGAPSRFERIAPQPWQVLVIGIGIAAAAAMLLGLVLPLRPGPRWALLGVGVAVAAALAFGPEILDRKALAQQSAKVLALLSALVFPTLGLASLARRLDAAALRDSPPAPWPRVALISLGALLGVSAVSLAGGLLVAALLSSNVFLTKGAQFSGVKLAVLAPLLVRVGGKLAPVASAGATSSDTTLPVIQRYTDSATTLIAVVNGLVLTLLVPFLVTFLL